MGALPTCPSFPLVRHSRAGGNPVITRTPLDSRLRGNDLLVDSRLRGNDLLVDSRLRGNDLLVDSRLRGNDLLAWPMWPLAWLVGLARVHGWAFTTYFSDNCLPRAWHLTKGPLDTTDFGGNVVCVWVGATGERLRRRNSHAGLHDRSLRTIVWKVVVGNTNLLSPFGSYHIYQGLLGAGGAVFIGMVFGTWFVSMTAFATFLLAAPPLGT